MIAFWHNQNTDKPLQPIANKVTAKFKQGKHNAHKKKPKSETMTLKHTKTKS